MAKLLPFPAPSAFDEVADLTGMSRAQLLDRLNALRSQIDALNQLEPRSQTSQAYEAWADRHELLEDLTDDVLDRLDELE